jgi:hypothetical protein
VLHNALSALAEALPTQVRQVIVVTPHEPHRRILAEFDGTRRAVIHIQDQQDGKPAALNLALARATQEVAIVTDGDVEIQAGAVARLLQAFDDPNVGAATGRPVVLPDIRCPPMLEFWGHTLFGAAHAVRTAAASRSTPIECSGFLYAFRRDLIGTLPRDVLCEDAYVSGLLLRAGFRVAYVPDAVVRVRPPGDLRGWWQQKLRALVGSQQTHLRGLPRMRAFGQEVRGVSLLYQSARSGEQRLWLLVLLGLRLAAWISAFKIVHSGPIRYGDFWEPIGTTKPPMPQVGEVYALSNHAIESPSTRPASCVVIGFGGSRMLHVVPRVTDPLDRRGTVPSEEEPPFEQAGMFWGSSLFIEESVLGTYLGRCPAGQFEAIRGLL